MRPADYLAIAVGARSLGHWPAVVPAGVPLPGSVLFIGFAREREDRVDPLQPAHTPLDRARGLEQFGEGHDKVCDVEQECDEIAQRCRAFRDEHSTDEQYHQNRTVDGQLDRRGDNRVQLGHPHPGVIGLFDMHADTFGLSLLGTAGPDGTNCAERPFEVGGHAPDAGLTAF